jgi:hypothetical protein
MGSQYSCSPKGMQTESCKLIRGNVGAEDSCLRALSNELREEIFQVVLSPPCVSALVQVSRSGIVAA